MQFAAGHRHLQSSGRRLALLRCRLNSHRMRRLLRLTSCMPIWLRSAVLEAPTDTDDATRTRKRKSRGQRCS